MSREKKSPSEIVSSFWSAFEAGRMDDLIRDHVAERCVFVMPGSPPLTSAAAIRGMFEAYRVAFPDFAHRTLHAIESGDTYAAETAYSGTHRGALVSPAGAIPPTGREVRWQSADVVRVEDGKITSWHVYHDPTPMLAQLGVALG
jgi:ketosteroid isomerase-like protein